MRAKRILVLAKSHKQGDWCVAGREVQPQGTLYALGPWIRPVSNHGEGELDESDILLDCGKPAGVLDFVDVPLAGHAGDPCQPENWMISGPRTWSDAGDGYAPYFLVQLEERPEHLWREPGNRSDRVSHARLLQEPPRQSLYVIRPQHLRIRLLTNAAGKPKRQAVFRYHGDQYELSITDPVILGKYCERVPGRDQPPVEFSLPSGDNCLLCVSLARAFHDDHYKVVATIFENVP